MDSGTDTRTRRAVVIGAIVVAAAVALLLGVGAVWAVGQRDLAQVTAATGIPSCPGTTLTSAELDTDSGFMRTAIPLRKGTSCTVTVEVTNRSQRSISLQQVSVPVSGPDGGATAEVTAIDGLPVEAKDEEGFGAIDAVVDVDESIESGDSTYLHLSLRFRETSCGEIGDHMWVTPKMTVSSRIAARTIEVADFPVYAPMGEGTCSS